MVCFCCLCGCSPRTATIILGLVATLNYFIQLLVILLNADLMTADFSPDQYNAYLVNHILLLLIALLMLVGAIQENKWLLVPFIVFVTFQDILSLVVAVMAAQNLITSPTFNNGMMGLFLVSIFNCLILTWVLSMVVDYFRLLHYGYKSFTEEPKDVESGQEY